MPTYDFQCASEPCGKVFEKFLTLQDYEKVGGVKSAKTICSCGADAEQIILPRSNRARYAYLAPVVYYENPTTKEVILAAHSADPTPNGFVKKETGLINEQRKLVSRLNEQDRRVFQENHALEQRYLHDEMSRDHSDLRNEMQGWDQQYKDMAREAMAQASKGGAVWDRSGAELDFGYLKILE